MKNKKILIVDDEPAMRKNIVDLLSARGARPIQAENAEDALLQIKIEQPDIVLLDINLPGRDGLSTLSEIKRILPDLPVIIFTAFGTSQRAIKAMKAGAYDYIEKPFELDEFLLIIQRALDFSELVGEVKELRNIVATKTSGEEELLIGSSKQMREIFKIIGRVSQTDATVLIQGESGTGKELIADAIQQHSLRSNKPYIKVNCGGLSESLLESEIFGHEKGAFTGAISQRQGRFELANGGTIFLDEVNNMPQALQVKLLRLLQHQAFYRVGGEDPIKVDVRIIAASNKDVESEVNAGKFREDLYYRLNVVQINLPPLRERKEDIPLLVWHFLKKFGKRKDFVVPAEEMEKLMNYNWPGNVRELENVIQRTVVMARENVLTVGPLGSDLKGEEILSYIAGELKKGIGFKAIVANVEKELILSALNNTGWNRTKAAKFLKIHRRLLYSKMKEYKIQKRIFESAEKN